MSFGGLRNPRSGLLELNPRGRRGLRLFVLGLLLLPLAVLWGCAGIVSGQNSKPAAQVSTFSISGSITPAVSGSGATITLGGAASASTTADGTGSFVFSGLANGTYTITPSRAGFTFSPASATVAINGADVTSGANFAATANATFSISGTISPTAGGSGATVTLSGKATATTTANSSGSYTFSGLANGTYTVTPSHSGYTFSPTSQTATVNGANVTGKNFTATTNQAFNISGTISPTAGGSGATVTLSGPVNATTTANSSGGYTFSGLANGNYAVTPRNTGYVFSPSSQSVTISGANVTGLNFTAAAAPTFSISGTVSPTTGGGGATLTLGGAAVATSIADSSGTYSFTGLQNGNYSVTPSNTGFSFAPVSRNVTINGANLTGVNFTATAQVAHSVLLTWSASTSTVTGYNIYRSTVNGGPYTVVNSGLISGLSYTDSTVQNDVVYYYVATAVDSSGNESAYSTLASANVP
ncbi:MAG: beta strand repeat-containing protein [Candidatus Acidiferrum sp.]